MLARRREARSRVRILPEPKSEEQPDGSVTSRQVAEVTLPREELDRVWTPEYLERLAATYWRFLKRVSLGLLRVLYTPSSRELVALGRPLVLLRFEAPEYEAGGGRASVTWRISGGLLVLPRGRGKGYLRIGVDRTGDTGESSCSVRVTSEVASFYPTIAGWGWFSRIGRFIYSQTQARLHVLVTNSFLRSLARVDLAESNVGLLRPPAAPRPSASPTRR